MRLKTWYPLVCKELVHRTCGTHPLHILLAYLVEDDEEEVEPAQERIWETNVFLAAA